MRFELTTFPLLGAEGANRTLVVGISSQCHDHIGDFSKTFRNDEGTIAKLPCPLKEVRTLRKTHLVGINGWNFSARGLLFLAWALPLSARPPA